MADILLPPGRLVQGSLYESNKTDMDGKPLVFKTGQHAGQPREEFYMAVAIPKGPEQSWNQTQWGQQIAAVAVQEWPNGESQRPDFAWKIEDGDSQIPNKNNKRNCDKSGHPGNWIVKMSSSFQPTILDRNGQKQLIEPGMVKRGYYVQPFVDVRGNNAPLPKGVPGMHVNPKAVAFIGYGEEIVGEELDFSSVGFGQGPMPEGVRGQPPAGSFNPASTAAPVAAPAPAPATAPVTPPPAPEVLAPPPSVPEKKMTDKAGGITYEQFVSNGWTDEQLVQHGFMEA